MLDIIVDKILNKSDVVFNELSQEMNSFCGHLNRWKHAVQSKQNLIPMIIACVISHYRKNPWILDLVIQTFPYL